MGSGAMTNSMDEVYKADVIFITGTNTTWNHPVFGSMIKQAVKKMGKKLIVADPRSIDLAGIADVFMQQKNGTDVALLSGLQHIILKNGWENKQYIQDRLQNVEAYKESMEFFTPEKVEELTGVPSAKLYEAAELIAKGGKVALYYCMGITQHSHGVDNVKSCVNLQMITGNIGLEGTGVNPLRGQNNVQGACDMGGLPNVYTGYQRVDLPEIRKKFADYWKVPEEAMSLSIGKTLTVMIPEAGKSIKALYIMGENPMVSDPNLHHARECFEKLDLLIVQDIFLTETAKKAHVVFPAVSFAEKYGTVTNTERRVQLSNRAIKPWGDVRQDYEIIADLAQRFGHTFPRTPEGLFEEVRDLTPAYKGITYDRIRDVGIPWPCPNTEHPGTRFLHKDKFSSGLGTLTPMKYIPSAEEADMEWPMVLSTGRILQHFHTGSMTRRNVVLDAIVKTGHVELHTVDAARLGVVTGDLVRVSTRRGSIETKALVGERVALGSIFVPFHFAEAAANELTNDALDPIAKIPELKVCAARIEKVA